MIHVRVKFYSKSRWLKGKLTLQFECCMTLDCQPSECESVLNGLMSYSVSDYIRIIEFDDLKLNKDGQA